MLDVLDRLLVRGDLSASGQLFSLDNDAILRDADEALAYVRLQCLASSAGSNSVVGNSGGPAGEAGGGGGRDFPPGVIRHSQCHLSPAQASAVELCVARVCRSLKETPVQFEAHLGALLKLLARCADMQLSPATSASDHSGGGAPPGDPLPARLASDLLACLFEARQTGALLSACLPVLVKLLNCPNATLRRTVSSYLSLASVGRARLLAGCATPLIIAACEGNLALIGLLGQLQPHAPDAFAKHSDDLLLLLRSQPVQESHSLKCDLLRLLASVSAATPDCLLAHARAILSQLDADTSACGLPVLLNIQRRNPAACLPLIPALAGVHPVWPLAIRSLAEIFAHLLAAYPSQFDAAADVLLGHLELVATGQQAAQLLACLLELVRLNPRLFAASVEARLPALRASRHLASAGPEAASLMASLECLVAESLQSQQLQLHHQSQQQQQFAAAEYAAYSSHPAASLLLACAGSSAAIGSRSSSQGRLATSFAHFGSKGDDDRALTDAWPEHQQQQPLAHTAAAPDAVEKFCSKHYRKLVSFVARAKLRLPAPCSVWLEVKKRRLLANKRRLCLGFRCEANSERCLNTCPSTPLFSMITGQPRLWLHLLFLIKQAELGRAVSQRHPDMLPIRSLWCSLLQEAEFLPTVTSAFPGLGQLDAMLRELHRKRFFDLFEFNGAYSMWCCFECNHSPARLDGRLVQCEMKKAGSLGGWRVSQISLQEADRMLTVVTPRVTKSLSLKAVKPRRRANHDSPSELALELQSGGTLRVRRIQPVPVGDSYARCSVRQQQQLQATAAHEDAGAADDDNNWLHSMQSALTRSLSAQYLRHKRRSAAAAAAE